MPELNNGTPADQAVFRSEQTAELSRELQESGVITPRREQLDARFAGQDYGR